MGGYTGNELRFQELRVNLLFVIHVNRSRVESVGGEVFGRKVSSFEARLKIVEKSGRKIVKKSRWMNEIDSSHFSFPTIPQTDYHHFLYTCIYIYIFILYKFITRFRI